MGTYVTENEARTEFRDTEERSDATLKVKEDTGDKLDRFRRMYFQIISFFDFQIIP